MKRRSFLASLPVVVLFGRLLGLTAKAADPKPSPANLPLQPDWKEVNRRMDAGEWLVFNDGRTCLVNPHPLDGGIACDVLGEPLPDFKWTC